MKEACVGLGCFGVSLLVHGLAVVREPRPPAARLRFTELELAPLAAPAPPPPTPRAPEPAAKPKPQLPPKPIVAKSAPQLPLPEALPPRAAAPALPEPELSGKTLAAESGAGWVAPAGNGAGRDEPLRVGSGRTSVATPVVAAASPALPPHTLPLAELSRKPSPPTLTAALARNYPATARLQGKSGEAKVRVLIDARGLATSVTISSESSPGFGAACQKTLLRSQWGTPLGKRGEPTATFVTYRCRFQVED